MKLSKRMEFLLKSAKGWMFLLVLSSTVKMEAQDVTIDTTSKKLNHIYKAGEEGYNCFRIPALIVTKNKTLLAFAEARKNNCGDAGDIDLVVKRSSDGGRNWSALRVVWDDSANTCGNPAPVVEQNTGRIFLLSTWNLGTDHERDIINLQSKDTRRVFVLRSGDDGYSWSRPSEITANVKRNNWTWYATGPVNGIQIIKGKHKDRLVIPCDHIEAETNRYFSHAIYSEDRGQSWKLGGVTPQDGVNECTVAELSDGRLVLNMRNFGKARIRQEAFSNDGGMSWSDIKGDSALAEPVCQGSLIAYRQRKKRHYLIFSNPASQTSRTNMTVKLSSNDGETWPRKKLLYSGPAAYSNLAILPNKNIGCLYEAGYQRPYEGIVFETLRMKDLK